jgi:pimeloyl-CoA synthetase
MNEDNFNMSIRKFLKTVGVTAQREIEKAVRQAEAEGKLKGAELLKVEARITMPSLALDIDINGQLDVR